jgi:hypothetical protein
MKLLALIVLTLLLGCATVPPGTPATPVTTFDACSNTALKTAAQSILGAVTSALATGDPEGALAVLAGQTSAAEVLCAVQLVVAELQTKAEADALAAKELAAGQAYLTKHTPAPAAK